MSPRALNRRIRLLLLVFALGFAVTLGRAAWLQGVRGSSYESLALRQQRETIELPAGRGTIFDRTGEPLAIGEQTTTVFADPKTVVDRKKVAIAAGKTLGLDPDAVYNQAAAHFDDEELAQLLALILTINTWNRIALATAKRAGTDER